MGERSGAGTLWCPLKNSPMIPWHGCYHASLFVRKWVFERAETELP